MSNNNKITGLVLGGGGGKGAFQIGAWAAFRKYGLMKNINAISGTSVGALNAVLFALGDYDLARDIWLSISPKTVLKPNDEGDALFSREGLTQIIDALPLNKLKRAGISVYVTVHNRKLDKTETFLINKLPAQDIKQLLLVSSAMPVAYDEVLYNGQTYIDGGVSELGNVPVAPLYRDGHKDILVVALDKRFNSRRVNANKKLDIPKYVDLSKKYPDTELRIIKPMEHYKGYMLETLNFTHSSSINKIIEGYMAAGNYIIDNGFDISDTKSNSRNAAKSKENYIIDNGFDISKSKSNSRNAAKSKRNNNNNHNSKIRENQMRNKNSRVNVAIHDKVLALFKNSGEFETFLKMTNFGNPNLEMPTMGGEVFYEDIVELDGWRIQQHKLAGLKSHYRVLDENDVRRMWIMNPEEFLAALNDYEAGRETGVFGKVPHD